MIRQDEIDRELWMNAATETLWTALVDSAEFARWFECEVDGAFVAGATVPVRMPQYPELAPFWMRIVTLQPNVSFAFDWPARDGAAPDDERTLTTRVTFTLTPERGGTRVRVQETGFADLPDDLAARKLRENTGGWEMQLGNLSRHVAA